MNNDGFEKMMRDLEAGFDRQKEERNEVSKLRDEVAELHELLKKATEVIMLGDIVFKMQQSEIAALKARLGEA